MKSYILVAGFCLVIAGFLFGEPAAGGSAGRDDFLFRPVDFSPAAKEDLRKIGFTLAHRQIEAPDFTLKDLKGNPRSLSSFRGKLVVLNFWGVWCYACRLEMPSMQRFYDQFKDQGLEIVAVDVNDEEKTVQDYVAKNKLTFPVLLDTKFIATKQYGPSGFPTTFLIDQEGNVQAKLLGALEWDNPKMISVVKKLLATP